MTVRSRASQSEQVTVDLNLNLNVDNLFYGPSSATSPDRSSSAIAAATDGPALSAHHHPPLAHPHPVVSSPSVHHGTAAAAQGPLHSVTHAASVSRPLNVETMCASSSSANSNTHASLRRFAHDYYTFGVTARLDAAPGTSGHAPALAASASPNRQSLKRFFSSASSPTAAPNSTASVLGSANNNNVNINNNPCSAAKSPSLAATPGKHHPFVSPLHDKAKLTSPASANPNPQCPSATPPHTLPLESPLPLRLSLPPSVSPSATKLGPVTTASVPSPTCSAANPAPASVITDARPFNATCRRPRPTVEQARVTPLDGTCTRGASSVINNRNNNSKDSALLFGERAPRLNTNTTINSNNVNISSNSASSTSNSVASLHVRERIERERHQKQRQRGRVTSVGVDALVDMMEQVLMDSGTNNSASTGTGGSNSVGGSNDDNNNNSVVNGASPSKPKQKKVKLSVTGAATAACATATACRRRDEGGNSVDVDVDVDVVPQHEDIEGTADELSFLVQRCDLEPEEKNRQFMPYIT